MEESGRVLKVVELLVDVPKKSDDARLATYDSDDFTIDFGNDNITKWSIKVLFNLIHSKLKNKIFYMKKH